jgi:hypothetical protein
VLRLEKTKPAHEPGVSVIALRQREPAVRQSNVAPGTVDEGRTVLEKAGTELIDRGMRRGVAQAESIRFIKRDVDRSHHCAQRRTDDRILTSER